MSLVEKYFKGWHLRTATPDFEPGEEYRVVITNYDDAERAAYARVGDTKLFVDDTGRDYLDKIARVRVTEFDGNGHSGRAELLEVVGETTY